MNVDEKRETNREAGTEEAITTTSCSSLRGRKRTKGGGGKAEPLEQERKAWLGKSSC